MRGLLLGFILAALLSPLFGEASVARYLSATEGFSLQEESESGDPAMAARRSGLSQNLIQEADYSSLSTWNSTSEPALTIDVYETGDSRGAYQLFTWWRAGVPEMKETLQGLPVGNVLGSDQGLFWKGNYLLHVTGRGPDFASVFFLFAGAFIDTIPLENFLPVTVTHLPEEGLDEGSVRFYLGPATLAGNPDFPKSLLRQIGFEERAEVAYGSYRGEALFLIGYPTVALAKEYEARLEGTLGSAGPSAPAMKRSGILIGLATGRPAAATTLLADLQYRPQIQWLRDRRPGQTRAEQVTFFKLLVQTFFGIGILLLAVVGFGAFAGLTRYQLLRWFPGIYPERIDLKLPRD